MNKKLSILLIALLAVGMVSAGLLTYFGRINTTVNVDRAVTLTGTDCTDNECSQTIELDAGTSEVSNEYTATSQTSVDAQIELASAIDPADSGVTATTEHILESASIPWGVEGYIGADFAAGREYVTVLADMTLGDLDNIDFDEYVTAGYPVSVNILLDVDGDGEFESKKDLTTGLLTSGADDVLKIEFAYNGATAGYPDAYMESGDYNTWSFDGVGSIDDTAEAWLYSVKPGDVQIVKDTLANWKAGISRGTSCYYVTDAWYEETCADITVDEDTKVYGIQIESLGWIAESASKVKNIEINEVAQSVLTIESGQAMVFDLEVAADIAADGGEYSVTTDVEVQ